MLDAARESDADLERAAPRQRPLPKLRRQRAPGQKFHDEQRRAEPRLRAEDDGQILVVDRRHRPCLAPQPGRVLGSNVRQRLDRDMPAQVQILRAIDDSHATAAEAAVELKLPAEHERNKRRLELAPAVAVIGFARKDTAARFALHSGAAIVLGEPRHHGHPSWFWRRRARFAQHAILDSQRHRPADGLEKLTIFPRVRRIAQLPPEPDKAVEGAVSRVERHQQTESGIGEPVPFLLREPSEGRVGGFEVDEERRRVALRQDRQAR